MTRVDYSRIRGRIAARKQEQYGLGALRHLDQLLNAAGYSCPNGTYSRITGNAVITRHMIEALCKIFECDRSNLVTDHEWARLTYCRQPGHDHETKDSTEMLPEPRKQDPSDRAARVSRALHDVCELHRENLTTGQCDTCDQPAPCRTVRALKEALGETP